MLASDLINLASLLDDAKCFELIRRHRWPSGVRCVKCSGTTVIRHGHDDTQRHRQRYRCKDCDARFDDLAKSGGWRAAIPIDRGQPIRLMAGTDSE